MSVPFHKQTDLNKQAGQVVFSPPVPNTGFDREPYLKHSNVAPDVTLSDYITRKQEGEKRITFDEWVEESQSIYMTVENKEDLYWLLQKTWNAALTKGKL